MPYLHLDVPNRYPVDVKRALARRLGDHYARIMQTTPELVTVAFRELGEGGVWCCGAHEPEPAALLSCDSHWRGVVTRASGIHANSLEATMATTIKVNGVDRTVDVDGDTPLLWVLRDVLGMTGTKFGCGMALCGACTVHVDGVATRSCITPIDSIGSSAITTIEGIGATAAGAKIQKAWLDREVVQCGYCQSGQIMSASALLASNPSPTDSDIDDAMSGNICRCGTYVRIREAIKQAAQPSGRGG